MSEKRLKLSLSSGKFDRLKYEKKKKMSLYSIFNLVKNINKFWIFMFNIIRSLKFTQTLRYSP